MSKVTTGGATEFDMHLGLTGYNNDCQAGKLEEVDEEHEVKLPANESINNSEVAVLCEQFYDLSSKL